MRTVQLIAAAALAISQVEAFWGTAHLIIARRAQDLIQSQNYSAYEAALAELAVLESSDPSLTSGENNHPLTECATFADDIKGKGYSFQAGWHFIDQPYLSEGGSLSDFTFVEDVYDVLDALTNLTEWLSYADTDYQSGYYYKTIHSYFPDEAQARSFALRLVIHYVGDIHQPLHAVAEVNSDYPSGDRGGNDEKLPSKDGADNLHAVWDSVAYEYTGRPNLPLSSSDWSWYTQTSQTMASQYSVNKNNLHDGDFQAWADESLTLAQSTVYPGVVEGQALSSEYVASAQDALGYQIMYGGYRLNNLLQSIYGGSNGFLQ